MPTRIELFTFFGDYVAMASAAASLAGRAANSSHDPALKEVASRIAPELRDDRDALRAVGAALGAPGDPLKKGGALVGERLGRLKPNGHLLSRSPLSEVTEAVSLAMLLLTIASVWEGLASARGEDPRLAEFDLPARAAAAAQRFEAVRPLGAPAVARALSD